MGSKCNVRIRLQSRRRRMDDQSPQYGVPRPRNEYLPETLAQSVTSALCPLACFVGGDAMEDSSEVIGLLFGKHVLHTSPGASKGSGLETERGAVRVRRWAGCRMLARTA